MSKLPGMSTVYLTVTSTTGRKKLLKDEVRIPDSFNLDELARLGTKTVFNPKALRPFDNCRKKAQAYLSSVGVRLGGGYAIPSKRLKEITQKVKEIENEFNDAKKVLLSSYENDLQEWLEHINTINPELATTISNFVISRSYLESQITFSFTSDDDENKLIGDKLIVEVSEAANTALDRLTGKSVKSKLNRKSLAYLTNIRDKLDSMSFLNSDVVPTVKRIDDFLDKIPKREALGVEWFQGLIKELSFLANPANFALLAQGAIKVDQDIKDMAEANDSIKIPESKVDIVDVIDDIELEMDSSMDIEIEPEVEIMPEIEESKPSEYQGWF